MTSKDTAANNGIVSVGLRVQQCCQEIASAYNLVSAPFMGDLSQSKICRLMCLAFLWNADHKDIRKQSKVKQFGFPNLTFVEGPCPNCGFVIDEQLVPIRQAIKGESSWKCNICGETHPL